MISVRHFVAACLLWAGLLPAAADPAPVLVLALSGPIAPASADFVVRGIQRAAKEGAQLVVLQLDTPGGLDSSMRQIIKEILASPVPVATYVAPGGARAASAGTYILYASHVAAMAPGTNLGAATPVQIGGLPSPGEREKPRPKTDEKPAEGGGAKQEKAAEPSPPADAMSKKIVHDAAAYMRGLAQLRGRNADWGELAVREAVSLSAAEALEKRVIDAVAEDVPALLRQLDGRRIAMHGEERVLDTAGARVVTVEPDWRTRILSVITDPNVAYVLLLVGIYGLFFEFSNPGFVLPGVAGAICLLLAMFAFQMLPVNYAGVALIALGIAFMVGEAFLPSFGALGIGGVIAFVMGSLMLIDTEVPGFGIAWPLVAALALGSAAFLVFVVGMALKARRRPVVTGREEMIGAEGEMLEDAQGEGMARVHSEIWKVRAAAPLRAGQRVRVIAMDGLTLDVTPLERLGEEK